MENGKMFGYEWIKKEDRGSHKMWGLYHSRRIEITPTRNGEFRVFDVIRMDTVDIFETLAIAKKKAESYLQIYC